MTAVRNIERAFIFPTKRMRQSYKLKLQTYKKIILKRFLNQMPNRRLNVWRGGVEARGRRIEQEQWVRFAIYKRYILQGTPLTKVTEEDLSKVVYLVNNRPRKSLGFPKQWLKFFRPAPCPSSIN